MTRDVQVQKRGIVWHLWLPNKEASWLSGTLFPGRDGWTLIVCYVNDSNADVAEHHVIERNPAHPWKEAYLDESIRIIAETAERVLTYPPCQADA